MTTRQSDTIQPPLTAPGCGDKVKTLIKSINDQTRPIKTFEIRWQSYFIKGWIRDQLNLKEQKIMPKELQIFWQNCKFGRNCLPCCKLIPWLGIVWGWIQENKKMKHNVCNDTKSDVKNIKVWPNIGSGWKSIPGIVGGRRLAGKIPGLSQQRGTTAKSAKKENIYRK